MDNEQMSTVTNVITKQCWNQRRELIIGVIPKMPDNDMDKMHFISLAQELLNLAAVDPAQFQHRLNYFNAVVESLVETNIEDFIKGRQG